MAKTRTLTFSGVGVLDETFDFTGNGDTLTFRRERYNIVQVPIRTDIASQVEEYYKAFENDINDGSLTVTYDATSVSITSEDNTYFDNYVEGDDNNTTIITVSDTTTTQKVAVTMTPTFSEAIADKCNKVDVDLGFSQTVNSLRVEQFEPGTGAISVYDNASFDNTTINLELERKYFILHVYLQIDGQEEEFKSIFSPYLVTMDDPIVSDTAFGVKVVLGTNSFIGFENNQYAYAQTVEDGERPTLVYQSNNEFVGLLDGTYTFYVKDMYGCEKYKTVTITASNTGTNKKYPNKMLFMPNRAEGSFRLRQNASHGLSAGNLNLLTEELEDLVKINNFYLECANSQKSTFIFKSDYSVNEVTINYCKTVIGIEPGTTSYVEGTISPTVTKKSNNIERKTFLEGRTKYLSSRAKLAVYFNPGDIYNEGGSTIGSHDYDEELPVFYGRGVSLKVLGQATTINEILVEGGIQYAVTGLNDTTETTSTTIESIHTEVAYEDYKFEVDNSLLASSVYNIEIIGKRSSEIKDAGSKLLSHNFKVLSDSDFIENNYQVCFFFNNKSDRFQTVYTGGAKGDPDGHLYNVPKQLPMKRLSQSEIETVQLDNKETKIDYKTQHIYETRWGKLPAAIAGSLADAIDQTDNAVIDGMLCTSIGSAEIGHLGVSGWAIVKAKFAVSDYSNELGQKATRIPDAYYPVVVGL